MDVPIVYYNYFKSLDDDKSCTLMPQIHISISLVSQAREWYHTSVNGIQLLHIVLIDTNNAAKSVIVFGRRQNLHHFDFLVSTMIIETRHFKIFT